MKTLRIILGLLLIPLLVLAVNYLRPGNGILISPGRLDELLFLLVGIPVILLNFWAWTEPQIVADLFFIKKDAPPAAAEMPEAVEAAAAQAPLKLVEVVRSLGLILVLPLLLFAILGLIFRQSLIAPLVVAVITAFLSTAWVFRFRQANFNAILLAWFALVVIVPGIVMWPKSMSVAGTITNAKNKPIPQTVWLVDYRGQRHETQTDANGYYYFPDVPYGNYVLQIGSNQVRGEPESVFVREIQQNFVVGLPAIPAPTPTLKSSLRTEVPPATAPPATEAPPGEETPSEVPTLVGTTPPDAGPTGTDVPNSTDVPEPTDTPESTDVPTETPEVPDGSAPYPIYFDGEFQPAFSIGAISSGDESDWYDYMEGGEICMYYPEGQSWGEVYITVGDPTDPPRPGMDFSALKFISFDLMGEQGNESLFLALKDNTDPDNRSETKVQLPGISTGWKNYRFPLSQFSSADLHKLYAVTEFIFQGAQAENVCFRNIQFLP